MRRHHHPVLLPCFLLLALAGAGAASSSPSKPKPKPSPSAAVVAPAIAVDFVRRSCRSTRYPRVCESTLVPCAPAVGRSPRRLARAALSVGADRAGNCSAYIRGKKGGAAMKDCAELARSAAAQLRQSAAEMDRMGRAGTPRFAWALSNVQTWASAALTDTSTCLDSLAQAKGAGAGDREDDRDAVKRRVVAVAQATSNALALVNRLDPAS